MILLWWCSNLKDDYYYDVLLLLCVFLFLQWWCNSQVRTSSATPVLVFHISASSQDKWPKCILLYLHWRHFCRLSVPSPRHASTLWVGPPTTFRKLQARILLPPQETTHIVWTSAGQVLQSARVILMAYPAGWQYRRKQARWEVIATYYHNMTILFLQRTGAHVSFVLVFNFKFGLVLV